MLDTITQTSTRMTEARMLAALERKILWLSSWTVHNANHLRPNVDGVKVGGHQASSASVAAIMTALYLGVLRPEDRVAVKPHASPVFHAIQYLLGNQSRTQLERFRAFGGAQSYPSRTKDHDDVDFSTGSVGLGAAQTIFASLVQDYLRLHGLGGTGPEGRMIAIVGDAEMDEGNIYEALLEGARHGPSRGPNESRRLTQSSPPPPAVQRCLRRRVGRWDLPAGFDACRCPVGSAVVYFTCSSAKEERRLATPEMVVRWSTTKR